MRGRIENLARVFDLATGTEIADGIGYYYAQKRRILGVAYRHGFYDERLAVGAFAALSPNLSEKQNYNSLDAVVRLHTGVATVVKVAGYGRNVAKARAILAGDIGVLAGRKVTAFYHNTMNPTDDRYVTVDGHICNAWRGEQVRLTDKRADLSEAEYKEVHRCFLELARTGNTKGLHVAAIQAVIWMAWRRINSVAAAGNGQTGFDWDSAEYERQMAIRIGERSWQ